MALPLYLAQTTAEMAGNPVSEHPAFLACHFSPGGKGLSNLPESLTPGAMLILDDSTPMDGHDPELALSQLSAALECFQCECLLLDFQRTGIAAQHTLAEMLVNALPCSVGVSEAYARGLSCPVFLPPVPPDQPLSAYLAPWLGREIWLEAALDGVCLTLTEAACSAEAFFDFPEDGQTDKNLQCHYTVETAADSAIFRLWRTGADLDALLSNAQVMGVTKAIGLWQELGR